VIEMSTKVEQAKVHLKTCMERDDFPSHNCACNCDDVAELLAEIESLTWVATIGSFFLGVITTMLMVSLSGWLPVR
jgi:hypothetical protein